MEQAKREVDTIFGGSNGWGNKSATPSAPRTMGINFSAGVTMTQQETTFLAEGHETITVTVQNLHRAMM